MVKNFIRGECLDCLPTRSKLATKTVLYSENCIRSGNYGENVVHIFVTCPIAIDTQKALGLWDLTEPRIFTVYGIIDLFFVSNGSKNFE